MRVTIIFGIFVYASRTQPIEPMNEQLFIITFLIMTFYAIIFDINDAFRE